MKAYAVFAHYWPREEHEPIAFFHIEDPDNTTGVDGKQGYHHSTVTVPTLKKLGIPLPTSYPTLKEWENKSLDNVAGGGYAQ